MLRSGPEIQKFLSHFLYSENAFLVDEVTRMDPATKTIEAIMRTDKRLPIASEQRGDPATHPRHVSGPELLLLTGNLGCLHAYFFYGCDWQQGWVGFGNRVHRADFKNLARIGPELVLRSRETASRAGPKRVMLRYEFEFTQNGKLVYEGDQSAMFFLGADLSAPEA